MITIYDIAKQAGVSHTTVSMALRNLPSVSQRTRQRIQALAEDMGYTANSLASTLKTGMSKRIALLFPDLDVNAHATEISAFGRLCDKEGYETIVMRVSSAPDKMRQTLTHLLQSGVAACYSYLYDFSPVSDLVKDFLDGRRTMVVVGPPDDMEEKPGLYKINVDNFLPVRDLLNMLIAQGHRNIVHTIAASQVATSPVHHLICETLRNAGITDWDPTFSYAQEPPVTDYLQAGYNAARKLLKEKPGVTAVQCLNDLFAFGLMRGLMECGVRIPEDISVSGSDDLPLSELYPISLTTINMRQRECAELAWDIISHNLQGHPQPLPSATILKAQLIVRESTAAVSSQP